MKLTVKKHLCIIILLFVSVVLNSQTVISAEHSTIMSLKISYRHTSNSNQGQINAVPQATLTLKVNTIVTKVFFKIIDVSTPNALIYQSNHLLNTPQINSPNNSYILFSHLNNTINLSNGQPINLKLYKYVVQTEDASGNLSELYELIN